MSVHCPNCDEDVELPDEIDENFGIPLCEVCGCALNGYSADYRRCERCGTTSIIRSDSCIVCECPNGTRREILVASQPDYTRTFSLPPWWSYSIDRQSSTVRLSYTLITEDAQIPGAVEMLAKAQQIAVDTETTGLDPYTSKLVLLQIATPSHVYLFDIRFLDKSLLSRHLRAILESEETVKILHNSTFDYKFIRVHLGISLTNIFDTMLANSLLSAGTRISGALKAIAKMYFDIDLEKDIRLSFDSNFGLTREQLEYAASDAALLFLIHDAQSRQLAKDKLMRVAEIEFRAIQPIAEMELSGVLIDVPKWKDIIREHKEERDRLEAEVVALLTKDTDAYGLYETSSSGVMITSQKQVMSCFASLGIQLPDTKEETLAKIDHPAAKKLLEFREHDKVVTSFGDSFLELINPVTNRIHPDFRQYGAETGRLSCQHPNVQQIPAYFRECFIAPPGWKVVTCDYSQAELRILAQLSRDPGFCSAFNSGGDLHSITASKMFKVPLENVSKNQRSQAKAINFGLAYGMGAAALGERIGVEKTEAEKLIAQYFEAYPRVASWLEQAADEANRFGYSKTPLGRKRYYTLPEKADPEYRSKISSIQRQGKNTPIQGANADMTKLALRFIFDKLDKRSARIVNTVHDEIVVEVRADEADKVTQIVADEMRRAGQVFITDVPIEVGVVTADTWSK